MDQGFDRTGAPVAADAEDCVYVLSELNGRTSLLRRVGETFAPYSMYDFGQVACWSVKVGFSWKAILEELPDPDTQEKRVLSEKLTSDWDRIEDFVKQEIQSEGISREFFDELVEVYSRLFPAFGHYSDMVNFMSDNYYSFDPAWNFRSFHSAPDFRTLIEEAFGVYRKDLARAVSKSNGSVISMLSYFKDEISSEQMVRLIEENRDLGDHSAWGFLGSTFDEILSDLSVFSRLAPALKLRLIEDLFEQIMVGRNQDEVEDADGFSTANILRDTLVMLDTVPDSELKRFRSDRNWDQVHGRAVVASGGTIVTAPDSIPVPLEILELDGEPLLIHFRLKLLQTASDFLQAGSKSGLANCMGKAGYYTKSRKGKSYCFVVHTNLELVAGIEIGKVAEGWKVLQLNGPGNRKLEFAKALEDELLLRLNGDTELSREADRARREEKRTRRLAEEEAEPELEFIEDLLPQPEIVIAVRAQLRANPAIPLTAYVAEEAILQGDELFAIPERLLDLERFTANVERRGLGAREENLAAFHLD